MAWSRSSSNVIADPPPPSEASEYRAGSVGAFLTHLYRKAPAKESRKRWERVAQSRLPLPAVQGGPLSHALGQTATAQNPYTPKERTMSSPQRYAKKQAKARQRRRRTAQERLQRDRRQAQHAAEVLEQARQA